MRASGATSHLVRPTAQDFLHDLTDLVWYQEEPMISTTPYAQWSVLREASHHVRVLLNGQGGDELLAGYIPYHAVYLRQLLRQGQLWPCLREAWATRDLLLPLIAQRLRDRGDRSGSPRHLLRAAFQASLPATAHPRSTSNLKQRLLQDLTQYSLPALLRYEDRNAMAHSMESRLPWLDPELVATVLRLPESAIIRQGWNRVILRNAMQGVLPETIRTRRSKIGFTTPQSSWLFARRVNWQSLFHSPLFCSRKYWDGPSVARASHACVHRRGNTAFFWRIINVEIWLRVFFPAHQQGRCVQRPTVDFARLGDEATAAEWMPNDTGEFAAHPGRHLFAQCGDTVWIRAPLGTRLVRPGDDLTAVVQEATLGRMQRGDIIVVTERIVAITQGRSFPRAAVHARPLARFLTRFVHKTPFGIGLGTPETMELALREAGTPRVLCAAMVAALLRPFGVRGPFYAIAGPAVTAIDGPTPGTIAPYCDHMKLGPVNPQGVAEMLRQALDPEVEVAIVDANDLGVRVLGHTKGVPVATLMELLADNPKAQGKEQTPLLLVRPMRREAMQKGTQQAS